MSGEKTILITGVSSFFGKRLAERLLSQPGIRVIGLDTEDPPDELKNPDYIQADIRNPLMSELLLSERIHTVCHLAFHESERPTQSAFDFNVMGTRKLFAACAEAGVRRLILMSSTAVYGAHPENSAFLSEDHPIRASRAYGYTRDLLEVEAFCNEFRQQTPEIRLTVLRYANIIGPTVSSPMTRFLMDPLAPTLLGFDPMMQFVHEADVVGVLVHTILDDEPGVYNVAAAGVLPLSRVLGLAGKIPVPIFRFCADVGFGLLGSLGVFHHWPIEPNYLSYPWVGDLAKMQAGLGYSMRYTAIEALREFAGARHLRRYLPNSLTPDYDEQRLRDTIERRRRERERQAEATTTSVEEG